MNVEQGRIQTAIRQTLGEDFVALLEDNAVIEIMRNTNGLICVERAGKGIEPSTIVLNNRSTESLRSRARSSLTRRKRMRKTSLERK